MGIPGQSLAIETASRVGVSPQIVERAIELLSPEAKAHHQAMSSLESVRAELSEIKKQLSKELSQARKAKEKYTDLLEKFRREKDEQLQLTVKKAEKKLDEVIRTAVAGDIFRRHEKIQEIRNDFPEIIRTPRNNESANITSATEFAQKYPPGTYVFVPSIGREGVIQGEPNSKGEIPILSESMRLFIHWKQLEPSRLARNPTAKLVRRSSHSPTVALNDQDRTVDLRGKSADEAIELLEIQLDRAAMNDEERIKVIHGHGTDTLKKAVRNYLSRSTYVQGWSAGGRDSGGDGITWIQLKD
jgi:DNA mismatch repair protein MutS2